MRNFLVCCFFSTLLFLTAYSGMFGHDEPVLLPNDVGKTAFVEPLRHEANLATNAIPLEVLAKTVKQQFEHSPGIVSSGVYIDQQQFDYKNALRHYANLVRTREILLAERYASRAADKPDVVRNGEVACKLGS